MKELLDNLLELPISEICPLAWEQQNRTIVTIPGRNKQNRSTFSFLFAKICLLCTRMIAFTIQPGFKHFRAIFRSYNYVDGPRIREEQFPRLFIQMVSVPNRQNYFGISEQEKHSGQP